MTAEYLEIKERVNKLIANATRENVGEIVELDTYNSILEIVRGFKDKTQGR